MRWRAVVFLSLCAATAACSSLLGDFSLDRDSSDAGVGGEDTGSAEVRTADASTVDAAIATADVRAIASGVAVYLGQTAALDASKSTTTLGTLTFSWGVDQTPPGSHIANANLAGRSSAATSFVPDVVGTYSLHVTVTALGSMSTAPVTVVAALPQVLFAQGVATGPRADGGASQGSAYYTISDLDGGNAHPVLCPDVVTNASSQGAPFAALAGRAYDYWEAPPGQLSRFAAFTIESAPDAGLSAHLWAGTTGSTCDVPPVDLGATRFGPGRPFGSEPNFKPDGTRFVVFDRQWRIVTFSADGTGTPHVVATYPVPSSQASSILDPVGIGSGNGYLVEPPRVTWTASGLAWAQPIQSGWEIVTAPDISNATLATYLTCPGVTPREIAMLADGTVIASYRQTPSSSENLYLLKPDAQRNCTHGQQYTHLGDPGSSTATDFALSPDGAQIAFLQIDTTAQDASAWMQGNSQFPGGYVYVVPVSGGTPTQVSSAPALYGPRWIAGGTALVFTRLDGIVPTTGRPATSVVVVAPDGGGQHAIAQGDGVTTFVSTSGNAACNAGGAAATSGAGLWLVPALGLVMRHRRRRR
jgi:hypothetical protein